MIDRAELSASPATAASQAANAAAISALQNESGFRWVHADSAARLAQSVSAADRGKLSFQTDIARVYRLTTVSPVQWTQLEAEDIHEWRKYVFWASGVSSNPSPAGFPSTFQSAGGTSTARAPSAGGTKGDAAPRLGYPTTASAGQSAYIRPAPATSLPSNSILGIRAKLSWTANNRTAGMRWFAGFSNANGTTPSGAITSLTHLAGVGREANSNVQFFSNDGSGTADSLNLGASFPGVPSGNHLQELELLVKAASLAFVYRNLDSGAEVSGTISTNILDTASAQLYFYFGNVADAAVVSMDPILMAYGYINR